MAIPYPPPARRLAPVLALAALLAGLAGCKPNSGDPAGPPRAGTPEAAAAGTVEDQFQRLSTQGKGFYESGDPARAVEVFRQASGLLPTHPDGRQNLANALLRANDPAGAAEQATELIRLNQNLSAAHFLLGAALLRQGRAEDALAQLQVSKDIDRTVNATSYLLARAHQDLGHFEDALTQYEEVLAFETNHPAAHYNLSQVLNRLGRPEDAQRSLDTHRAIQAQRSGASIDQSLVERCVHTEIRVPFRLEQPEARGTAVTFVDATEAFLGTNASRFSGPIAVLDINHNGTNDLFVRDGDARFRLLLNDGGRLRPAPAAAAVTPGGRFHRVLVGDLNKDRYEDVVILGEPGLHAFRLATNGALTDSTAFSNLRNQPAVDGLLADLDFTGSLDLVLVTPTNRAVRILRNLGNMYFTNATAVSGFAADLGGIATLVADDWNGDELNDFLVGRPDRPPLLLTKQRGGPVTNAPPSPADWPTGALLATGDLNNDFRNDLVVATSDGLVILFNGFPRRLTLPLAPAVPRGLRLLDYDNDGWLDLLAVTDQGLRAWRNAGEGGFPETSESLGLRSLPAPSTNLTALAAADLDNDGDTDLVAAGPGTGLLVLRNEGGNALHQLQLRLLGTRSNPSGLGLRVELTSGNWRTLRTVHALPIEIGVGRRDKIDTLNVRWFDTMSTDVDTPVQPGQQVSLVELIRPTGSCPYLYRWDGHEFRFVTDLLGAAPLGLPAAEGHLIAADPDEIVRLGSESEFPARNGAHVIQITEELREVLYLDEARLLVVDHPEGTEVHPLDKLMPGPPFPPSELMTLRRRIPLLHAANLEGTEVTGSLQSEDASMVSPVRLRAPQLRGHAEPHGVILDFGPLDPSRPCVLALTGWLRFGGGMANIAASRDPEIPFPFPRLEAETATGWKPVPVEAGAPAGKTKTILVDLQDRLPADTRRLRLTAGFEIHWDRIALFEKAGESATRVARVGPSRSDLHWRGYSEFKDLPWTQPLTPDYARVRSWPDWRITPSGWCTRYGPVDELLAARDGGLVLLNGGDELTLEFDTAALPPRTPGTVRTFFLFTVGWDKDADFHVVEGHKVGPLPWEGMDDQLYGRGVESRPPLPGDALNTKYNTRWVGPMARIRK